jgi:hypothetical protein
MIFIAARMVNMFWQLFTNHFFRIGAAMNVVDLSAIQRECRGPVREPTLDRGAIHDTSDPRHFHHFFRHEFFLIWVPA